MSTAASLQTMTATLEASSNSTHTGLLLQRTFACGSPISSLIGEWSECKSKKRLQAKLTVGASNDPLEHEADRIADQVMRVPAPEVSVAAAAQVSRTFAECDTHTEGTDTAPGSVDRVLASSGKPLESALRRDMEQRFGHDFSRVRVHSGAAAEQSARDVNARAYTVGRDIVFGVGQFAPATPGGRRLLAHELTHVLQQSAGNQAVATVVQRQTDAEGAYKIISQVWQVAGRDIVVVATGYGDQVLFFYRSLGIGDKGAGVVQGAGHWLPFKTLMAQDESILGAKANPEKGWFSKNPYYNHVAPKDPLRGLANKRNQQVGAWLDKEGVPAGEVKDWQVVEQEMDSVANKYRQSVRGGGPGGGGAGGGKAATQGGAAEVKGTAAEVKGAETEAKAVGAEAKLVGAEAKALKAEKAAAKTVAGAARATKAARIGRLLMALAMPGPEDVFLLFIEAFASITEAKAKLRGDAYALGFAQGLAAVITWTRAADAERMLLYKTANPSIGERVAGFEGVREKGTNDGVMAGWKFANALNGDQRKGFRAEALAATGLRERRHSSRDDLIIGRRPQADRHRAACRSRATGASEGAGGGMATGEPAPAHVMRLPAVRLAATERRRHIGDEGVVSGDEWRRPNRLGDLARLGCRKHPR